MKESMVAYLIGKLIKS